MAQRTASSYASSNLSTSQPIGGTSFTAEYRLGISQSFLGNGDELDYIGFYIKRYGSPTGSVGVHIYSDGGVSYGTNSFPNTLIAGAGMIDVSTIGTTSSWVNFYFTGANRVNLVNGVSYVAVISYEYGSSGNELGVGIDTSSPTHDGNYAHYIVGSGAWTPNSGYDTIFTAVTFNSAKITNSIDYTIGTATIPVTFDKVAGEYVQCSVYVGSITGGNLIKTVNLGTASSNNISLDSADFNAMYAKLPNATSGTINIRTKTFTSSAYTTQIGVDRDKSGTISVNQAINKPTFTTYTIGNLDKNVEVEDKYSNALVTSSTETLTGSASKMIKAYSTVRAVVTSANKMVALNSATAIKYRLTSPSGFLQEENYSADSTVNIDLVNPTQNSFSLSAIDSRGLLTTVDSTLTAIAEYEPILVHTLLARRDNNIDEETKLSFGGQLWNDYFGGGTDGELNELTAHIRFKPTTREWEALNGTATMTIASPCVVTKTGHGFVTGDVIHFTTSGALPTGITSGTTYYVIYLTADTFKVATTKTNAIAGTAINTSGSQSGTHTVHGETAWLDITADVGVSAEGVISYDEYINGDLGAGGFDKENSFDIELRVFDLLSQQIIETRLNKGVPIAHFHADGVAIKALYDETVGGSLQVDGWNMTEIMTTKWIPISSTLTYASADDPSFTFTVAGDETETFRVGAKFKVTQTTDKFFIVTKSAYSAPNTTVTIYGGTDYDLANATLVTPYISYEKAPLGFPLDMTKWQHRTVDTNGLNQNTPTANVWYNLGSISLAVPIGCWRIGYQASVYCTKNSAVFTDGWVTLSTANNSQSDTDMTIYFNSGGATGNMQQRVGVYREKIITIATKQTRYLNIGAPNVGNTSVGIQGSLAPTVVFAICAYL